MLDPLHIFADLTAAGRSPGEALALLARTGCGWAAEAAAAVEAGADPASALARTDMLSARESAAVGGAAALTAPSALRFVARRRATRRVMRRAALRSLALPALAMVVTVAPLWWMLPRGAGAVVVDLLPFLVTVAGVALLGVERGAARLPGARAAEVTAALAAAAPLDARGFERAARLLPVGRLRRACERAGRRLAEGGRLEEVLPSAAEVGAGASRALLVGAVSPEALAGVAAEAERVAVGRAAWAVRLLGWGSVFFAAARLTVALLSTDVGSIEGLEQMMPGVDPAMLDELMRELDGL